MDKRRFPALALLTAAIMFGASPVMATEVYRTDQGHTEVMFSWNHAGVSRQTGEFTRAEGILSLEPDNIAASSLDVTIDAASLSSGFGPLDDNLKSADFLEVATYPDITFKSTSVTQTGAETADVTGDLTIHGVTRPATLKVTLTHRGDHPLGGAIDYYKGKWVAFTATTEIDHMAYNVGPFPTGPIAISIVTEMKEKQ